MWQNVKPNWDESDSTLDSYIQNKPTLATVATSGSYNDLSNKPDFSDFLGFEAQNANSTIKLNKVGSPYAISLEYSTDRITWTEYTWDDGNGATITLSNIGDKVYFRGDNSLFSASTSDYYKFVLTGLVKAFGNIMTLLDKGGNKYNVPYYCFISLFEGNTLTLTQAPELPATSVGTEGYERMFYNCQKLAKAPELPAEHIGMYSYKLMFRGTKFKVAPTLPSGNIRAFCYQGMFSYNNELTTASEVKGGVAESCYEEMYYGCSSLVNAPSKLPATSLSGATNCYKNMFGSCTSLKKAPELPATTLSSGCYQFMFSYCTALTTVPELPATTLSDNCYAYMFRSCTSLTTVPELPATTLASNCYTEMFKGCTKLKYIRVEFASWGNGNGNWLDSVYSKGVFSCPSSLPDTRGSSYIPTNWIKTQNSNEPADDTLKKPWTSTASVFTVCPQGDKEFRVIVSSALTLNAMYVWEYAYAEIVLDIAEGATVTAGTGITFVDEPTAGKLNVCVVRWADQKAKLYVILTEDHDESSSSN